MKSEDFADVTHADSLLDPTAAPGGPGSLSWHEPVSVLMPGSLACLVKGGLLVPNLMRFSAQFV